MTALLESNTTPLNRRQQYLRRNDALKSERSSWEALWQDINDFIQPRRGRFFTNDKNKGDRKDRKIVNNSATRASRILASGLMAGLTNPSRPWFRLNTPDPSLNEFGPVKTWLSTIEDRMRWAFQRSNIYLALHSLYRDMTFGVSAMHVEEDAQRVLRAYLFPIGSYALQNSARLRVDTIYREFQMTTGQLVERFGEEAVSQRVREAYARQRFDEWHEVLHVVEPNRDVKPGRMGHAGMAFKSCWMELAQTALPTNEDKFLSESGFEEFPAMCPRWSTTGEDIYGAGPGEEAIGDAKALQLVAKKKLRFVERLSDPATQIPSNLRNEPVSLLPGAQVFVDPNGPASAVRPIYEPNPAGLTALEETEREHERRIEQAFYADLWLMFAETDRREITAAEINRRHEEKMLQLGPVLQRLEEELLDPLIERCFGIMYRAGMLPPPPREAQGMDLKVEYISILAQAQRLVGIQGVRELVGFVQEVAAAQHEAGMPADILDKLDTDQLVDEYANNLGTAANLVRTDEAVAQIRAQRAKAQQAQAQAEQAAALAPAAKQLSETDTSGKNALTDMLNAVGGPRAVG
jgi:hypothetical protein